MKPLHFNSGFNVIFGDVEKSSEDDHEHNLGKSTLVDIIDFLLLKKSGSKNKLFKYKKSLKGWCFYIELELNDGRYLTIKRSVDVPSLVSFKIHNEKDQDYTDEKSWDELDSKLYAKKNKDSVTYLEEILDFDVLSQYPVRFFLSYLLRNQNGYAEVFDLDKFEGAHVDWKAPLFNLLGFDEKYVLEKYRIQYEIDNYKRILKTVLGGKKSSSDEAYTLKAAIVEAEREEKELENKEEKFDFYLKEKKINRTLVEDLDKKINRLNSERYRLDSEIERVKEALSVKVVFDIEDVKKVFEETRIYFPDQLKKDYESLLDFNTSVSEERSKFLKDELAGYLEYLDEISSELKRMNSEREEYLSFLRSTDTFAKYKNNQAELNHLREKITLYKAKLESLSTAENYEDKIDELKREADDVAKKLKSVIDSGNELYNEISRHFSDIFRKTLDDNALLVVRPNQQGNPEFESITINESSKEDELTGESDGHTFGMVQCASFVLSVLMTYSEKNFYRFAYHDGLLEGWGNNPKRRFIEEVRRICDEDGIQYIVSMIKSDVPDNFEFKEGEIRVRLDDNNKLLGFNF